jgi:hypothetical protein
MYVRWADREVSANVFHMTVSYKDFFPSASFLLWTLARFNGDQISNVFWDTDYKHSQRPLYRRTGH